MRNIAFILCMLGIVTMVSCNDDFFSDNDGYIHGNGFSITAVPQGIIPVKVDSRSNERDPLEQEIKNMHVFLFDSKGNYLQSKSGFRFQGYTTAKEFQNTIRIDNKGFAEEAEADNATVVIVANVEDGTFNLTEGSQTPVGINNLTDLEQFYYAPKGYSFLEELPETGMPMFAKLTGQKLVNPTSNVLSVSLKALMAKIKVEIGIDSEKGDNNLPSFTFTEWEVSGMPSGVYLTSDGTTATEPKDGQYKTMTRNSIRAVHNKGEKLSRYFYVFENIKYKTGDYNYPTGTPTDNYQFYKPLIAPENSVLLTLHGRYITYDGLNYDVTYKLYLGGDNYQDFAVKRNHQYNNNITIEGITHSVENGEVTFDARVNVEQSTPVYISLLRQRNLDSHFNVVPLDVFWIGEKGNSKVDISVEDPSTNYWVRFEKVPADVMKAANFAAGTGKRKWFTEDLVTKTLLGNTSCEDLQDRDRIYLYIDENISTKPRSANLLVTYTGEDGHDTTTKILLEQRGLMEVVVYQNNNGAPGLNEPVRHYLYIEDIEEFLYFYDPYSEYSSELHFEGLPWGCKGGEIKNYIWPDYKKGWWERPEKINNRDGEKDPWFNLFDGMQYTYNIINEDMIKNPGNYTDDECEYRLSLMKLNDRPRTAAEYCMNKNKRNAEGKVPYKTYDDANNSEKGIWYLPGIRELEAILRAYYIRYPEFQGNYYWSSAAGEKKDLIGFSQDNNRARATKATLNSLGEFDYEESGYAYPYEQEKGGSAYRDVTFRIRAAYGPFASRPSWAQ